MLKSFLERLLRKNRALILWEAHNMCDFMGLLQKRRNTGVPWTPEEIKRLKSHLLRMSLYVPSLLVFLLPGGYFLLPVLAEVLDRREKRRQRNAD